MAEESNRPLLQESARPREGEALVAASASRRAIALGTRTDTPDTPDAADGHPSSHAAPRTSPVIPQRIHQYEFIRQLGRGGMGTVFLARDTRLGRRVAIKLVTHQDPVLAARFRAEAQATAQCKHDNIVDIYDIGDHEGHSYMVLEYLEGVTLRRWMSDRVSENELAFVDTQRSADDDDEPVVSGPGPTGDGRTPISATLAAEVLAPVARALVHAHGLGLVHRDLKPENIMLTGDGSTKVLDFGIATLGDSQESTVPTAAVANGELHALWSQRGFQTRAGTLVGTLPYMSPEQWRGERIDQRADVWAMGIMLWEMMVGHHPLAPVTHERLATVADLQVPMPQLGDIRPDLGDIASAVDGCLTKSRAERLTSAQLLGQLTPLLPGFAHSSLGGAAGENRAEPDNPFTGLAAFQEIDAARFFGREREIASVVSQLRHQRMVAVIGPSGAGKSSLVRAGVIPALKRSGEAWESFVVRPGRDPMGALAEVLERVSRMDGSATDLPVVGSRARRSASLRAEPGHLGELLRSCSRRRRTRALLFVDQFEELYTLNTDVEARRAFAACLEGVGDDASSPLRVVLSLRSDYLDRIAEDRTFSSELLRGMILLAPMEHTGLRDALVRPLHAVGYAFEARTDADDDSTDAGDSAAAPEDDLDLVDRMLAVLQATQAPLPLLQFTAAKLWATRDRERRLLTLASYRALGGVAGALSTHANQVLGGLSAHEHELARIVMTSLVTDERTRAIVGLDELRAQVADDASDALTDVIQRLADARLITLETDDDGGSAVELSHESLITRWPRLVQWLDEGQEEKTDCRSSVVGFASLLCSSFVRSLPFARRAYDRRTNRKSVACFRSFCPAIAFPSSLRDDDGRTPLAFHPCSVAGHLSHNPTRQ